MTRPFASSVAATAVAGMLAFAAVTVTVTAQGAPGAKPAAAKPVAAKPVAAKGAIDRTPDGHPDFQGVWANNTVTPLERPKQWEGKKTLTDKEITDLQNIANQIYDNDGDAQFGDGLILAVLERQTRPGSYDPGTGNYNQFWLVGRDWHDRRTSLIQDPPDGKIPPMTADAKARRETETAYFMAHQYEDPEMIQMGERCVHFGLPRTLAGYNSYLQIVQTPTHLMVMNEMAHDARVIPLDGRSHLPKDTRKWNGDSVGRWEGDTLVVDTTNFSPKNDFMGAHENLHLVERFTRVSPDVLNYEFTVEDPTTWTRPWTVMIPLKQKDEHVFEYACHESNEAMIGMLKGHRFEEAQAKKGSASLAR